MITIDKSSKKIDLLKEVKIKVKGRTYSSSREIYEDFYKIINQVWRDMTDLYHDNLEELYKIHSFLLEEIAGIMDQEESKTNYEILEGNHNFKKASKGLVDGKRAFKIYYLDGRKNEHYVIGDIHSDTISIDRILEKTDFFSRTLSDNNFRLVFLGDYVDRGKSHLKVMHYILSLKYLFPENIILQRGNHDFGSFEDGQVKMMVRKPEKDLDKDWFLLYLFDFCNKNKTLSEDIIHKYLSFFDDLSTVSFIDFDEKIFMLSHGGIARPREEGREYDYIRSISDLTNTEIVDILDKNIVSNMVWSDPAKEGEDLNLNNGRFKFTEEDFDKFRERLGFDILLRGHQVQEKGYKYFFNEKILNIFSSGKILQTGQDINRETAYGRVNPHIVYLNNRAEVSLLDLND